MIQRPLLRRLLLVSLTGFALAIAAVAVPIGIGALTPAQAQAQVSAEFESALEPYGHWVRHARWGEVWVPDNRPSDWRPYSYGYWVYTDEWGWYWVSDEEEEDWGWITYHYGRWAFDRRLGWFWVPDDEWAPAWVDWRRGDDYVGWAPLPPDEEIYAYDDNPSYWVFVAPRDMLAPRVRTYFLPPQRTMAIMRDTVVINRTIVVQRDNNARARIAVNAGVSPAIVAAARHNPVPAFQVRPHVLARTLGVAGAILVRPQDLSRRPPGARAPNHVFAPALRRTSAAVQPPTSVAKPQPLGKNERGRLGSHPPRAAQGAVVVPSAPPSPMQQPQHTAPPPRTAPPPQHAAPPPASPQVAPSQAKPQRPPAAPPQIKLQRPVAPPQVKPQLPVTRSPPAQPHPTPPVHPAPPPAVHAAPPHPPAAVRAAPPRPVAHPPPPGGKPPPKKPGEKDQEQK